MLNGMPITMLNGLGCAECSGRCLDGLGAASRADIEKFFVGTNKYVKNTKPINVFKNPGDAPLKTVAPNDTIGKVVSLNDKGNWAKLDDGNWISLTGTYADSFYTVILTTPPPKSISEAVGREIDNIPFLPSAGTIKLVIVTVLVVAVAVIVTRFKPSPSK
ncbi:MAG TPA: hypothetical protein VK589_30060 [Chryseolinea sp.]|nr:hypothetical protein [Chryseolinea sp.]